MMQGDDIRNQRIVAEKSCTTASEINTPDDLAAFLSTHRNLALWVIAEQLFELTHHLAAFREVIDPAAGEQFPAVVRVRIQEMEK